MTFRRSRALLAVMAPADLPSAERAELQAVRDSIRIGG